MTQAARPFTLFPFQEDAAQALRSAALKWVYQAATTEPPRYGTATIPFVGQLKAVTGAGKTPILAEVVSGLGDGVVIWTSKSSAVVEQTYNNLRSKYRGLLPGANVRIIREIPGQQDWHELINVANGLTIWVLTTASWNEAEAAKAGGAVDARLNLHRPQADWSGDTSPWTQLRTKLKRPLWIVSDESHNQTDTQLDQLAALKPIGFFMASATPVHGELFDEWQRILSREEDWKKLLDAGQVPVRTAQVVAAELLKTTIELLDFQSGTEESLDGALDALNRVQQAADCEGASVTPRAIYVVEKSNPPRNSPEIARPIVIWQYLISKGVAAESIAVYTDTKDLPKEAQRVSNLSQLQQRHTHIIFNQALQEGWDDPEAYVCYFDGETRSFVRIRQIVGRVLRQPDASRYAAEELNTATLILNTPTDVYEQVVEDLRRELRLYAPEEEPDSVPIRIKTRKKPLPAQPLKDQYIGRLQLPRLSLKAPNMSSQLKALRTEAQRVWAQDALDAPGLGRKNVVDLAAETIGKTELLHVLRSARTMNGIYLRRRLAARNRNALNAIDPDSYMKGPAYEQFSCQGSQAQTTLAGLADGAADYYEDRVTYDNDPDPDLAMWTAVAHRPRTSEYVTFTNAAHERYSRGNFNKDELIFAQTLDGLNRGIWLRNGDAGDGYQVPLPFKVGDSLRFFPDFVWWPSGEDGEAWALDTTGRHLIQEKIRGKLVGLGTPRMALVVRGQMDLDKERSIGVTGWSAVIGRPGLKPLVEHNTDLSALLVAVAELD